MSDFYADKRNRDGHMTLCKSCFNIKQERNRQLRKYGVSPDDRRAMLAAQGGRCPICNEKRKLVTDHDHVTGRVRALLCDRCNRLLGVVDDDPRLLAAAIDFLHKHSTT